MAFTKCSKCNEVFHLRITSTDSNIELRRKENSKEILCINCFRKIALYDIVEVISLNTKVPKAKLGDLGAVVLIHQDNQVFEIECVLEDGSTKWLGTFNKEQVKWSQTPNK